MQELPDVWERLACKHQAPDPLSWDDDALDLSSAVLNMVRGILSVFPWLFRGVEDFEDIAQDVILNVYRVATRFFEKNGVYPWRDGSECKAYFRKASANRVVDALDKSQRTEQLPESVAHGLRDKEASEPSAVAELHELWRWVAEREGEPRWATAYQLWRVKIPLREIEEATGLARSTIHEHAPEIHEAVLAHFARTNAR